MKTDVRPWKIPKIPLPSITMNVVEKTLLENAHKPSSLFVFPTDIAVSAWMDRLLVLKKEGTVAAERFVGWDTFKQDAIRGKVQDKKSVPGSVRKMFAGKLLSENAERRAGGGEPIFSSLIRSRWAGQSGPFAGWIAGILPQLAGWLKSAAGIAIGDVGRHVPGEFPQGEDRDLFNLARLYKEFLDRHDRFEPAWERPPFDDSGKECFIFFSESLLDFKEYEEILASSRKVTVVKTGAEENWRERYETFFYSNSQGEIAEAALYVLALHYGENVPWDSISVSIPDGESYGPYLFREFENRNIPYIRKEGKPLASYPAGQFFKALAACASSDFSFASLTALLSNHFLPWKDLAVINALIRFGMENNCISSWTEERDGKPVRVNVWEDAFAQPYGNCGSGTKEFFRKLKQRINTICNAASFSEIVKNYFDFRNHFFDMDNCLPETDLIISRCVSKLTELVETEDDFADVMPENPYGFFVEQLEDTKYLAQQSTSGVAVLPYQTAAPVPFRRHIVLGASQENLKKVFSPLAFLAGSRRKALGITDNDASPEFIMLHCFNSENRAAFFCSEKTFSGYAIPHSLLDAAAKPERRFGGTEEHRGKFRPDRYLAETDFFREIHFGELPGGEAGIRLHAAQKIGFDAWRSGGGGMFGGEAPDSGGCRAYAAEHPLSALIQKQFFKEGKLGISASSLFPYFRCPIRWMFERVLGLRALRVETGIMAWNTGGLVYHAVLDLFFKELMESGETIRMSEKPGNDKKPVAELPEEYLKLLQQKIDVVFDGFPYLPGSERTVMSMLTSRLLLAQKQLFFGRLRKCLAEFAVLFSGFRIAATEAERSMDYGSRNLKGIIDCVLEDANRDSETAGGLAIVDFKTRKTKKLADCFTDDGLVDFQIPAYQRLAESCFEKEVHHTLFFGIEEAKAEPWFGSLQNRLTGADIPKKPEDRVTRGSGFHDAVMKDFDDKVGEFGRCVSGRLFPEAPTYRDACRDCEYDDTCRVLYKVR